VFPLRLPLPGLEKGALRLNQQPGPAEPSVPPAVRICGGWLAVTDETEMSLLKSVDWVRSLRMLSRVLALFSASLAV